MTSQELGDLYQKGFNPIAYLDLWLSSENEIEKFISTQLFKVFQEGKVKGRRCVDIGAGPLVHRLGIASRVCDHVFHTDFTDRNRELVKKWLTTSEMDDKYSKFMKLVARLEGYQDEEEGAKTIQARLRSKLTSVLPIDIIKEHPLGDLSQIGGPFDCALSSACIESVSSSYEQFVQVARNIGNLLIPGAPFVLTGFLNGDYYIIGETRFPCLRWDADMVKRGLQEANYRLDFIEVLESASDLPREEADKTSNCDATFFALAYRL